MNKYPILVIDCETDEFEYDYQIDNLQSVISNKKNFTGYWYITGENMGWRNLSGYKYLQADNAKDLIYGIVPDCDYSLTIWNDKKGYKAKLSHHDSPTGETYYIKPISSNTYYKYN